MSPNKRNWGNRDKENGNQECIEQKHSKRAGPGYNARRYYVAFIRRGRMSMCERKKKGESVGSIPNDHFPTLDIVQL